MAAQKRSRHRIHQEYGVHTLVWFEMHTDIREAIAREKQIKSWNRAWKIKLIESTTPAGMICTSGYSAKSRNRRFLGPLPLAKLALHSAGDDNLGYGERARDLS